jgi:hypothetical protein
MSFGDPLRNHPKPHGKLPPVPEVQDYRGAHAAIEARRRATADAASAARVQAGNATLAETVAHLEAEKKTTTSQQPAKPTSKPDLREQNRRKIEAAEKAGGKVVSGAVFGKFF